MKIYLAGGMRPRPVPDFYAKGLTSDMFRPLSSDAPYIAWADIVQQALQHGHNVFDPRVSNTKVFEDYSFLDVLEIRKCDLVIAYLEAENPSGMGLAAEISYAKGLGKTVLLINEKHDDRYARFIENFADRTFLELKDAIPVIQKIRP